MYHFFHRFEVSEGFLRNSQHLRKPKNTGTKHKDGSGITFVSKKYIYIKSPKYHWITFVSEDFFGILVPIYNE